MFPSLAVIFIKVYEKITNFSELFAIPKRTISSTEFSETKSFHRVKEAFTKHVFTLLS